MFNPNAVIDLIQHEKETGVPLPLNERHIAALEAQGVIVDLVTGDSFYDPDFVHDAEETVQNGS